MLLRIWFLSILVNKSIWPRGRLTEELFDLIFLLRFSKFWIKRVTKAHTKTKLNWRDFFFRKRKIVFSWDFRPDCCCFYIFRARIHLFDFFRFKHVKEMSKFEWMQIGMIFFLVLFYCCLRSIVLLCVKKISIQIQPKRAKRAFIKYKLKIKYSQPSKR